MSWADAVVSVNVSGLTAGVGVARMVQFVKLVEISRVNMRPGVW